MRHLLTVILFVISYGPLTLFVKASPEGMAFLGDVLTESGTQFIWPALVLMTLYGLVELCIGGSAGGPYVVSASNTGARGVAVRGFSAEVKPVSALAEAVKKA